MSMNHTETIETYSLRTIHSSALPVLLFTVNALCLSCRKKSRTLAFQSHRANRKRSALYYFFSSNQFGVICLSFSSSVARLFAMIASLSMLGGTSGCPSPPHPLTHSGHLRPAVKTGKWQCLTVIVGGWRIPQGLWMVSRRSPGLDFTVLFCSQIAYFQLAELCGGWKLGFIITALKRLLFQSVLDDIPSSISCGSDMTSPRLLTLAALRKGSTLRNLANFIL